MLCCWKQQGGHCDQEGGVLEGCGELHQGVPRRPPPSLCPSTDVPALESQLQPADREKFPLVFTERMNWEETILAGHEYTWRRIIKWGTPESLASKL